MTISDLSDTATDHHALDPFAYQPGVASRVAGLVEGDEGDDPGYVFHTDYVTVGRGHAQARVTFEGLSARTGTLAVRVHMLRPGEQPRLTLVTADRIAFNRLTQNGGELLVRFEAFRNCRYALYGTVLGDTDARAQGLRIILDRPAEVDEADHGTEARNSAHGEVASRRGALLVSTDPPTLRAPVSQVATKDQLRSAEARAVLGEAALPDAANAAERWAVAYTARALEAYGMLRGDARGLGMGAGAGPVAHWLRGRGVEARCRDDGASDAAVNNDFLWRSDLSLRSRSARAWKSEVERALKALLPGGLGVFTFGYDPDRPVWQTGDAPVVTRHELEQLALVLVSRGHQVAQLRIVGDYRPLLVAGAEAPSVAGLIVRRVRIPD